MNSVLNVTDIAILKPLSTPDIELGDTGPFGEEEIQASSAPSVGCPMQRVPLLFPTCEGASIMHEKRSSVHKLSLKA